MKLLSLLAVYPFSAFIGAASLCMPMCMTSQSSVELTHGAIVRENIFADEIVVPFGAVVRVAADVQLVASRSVVIMGSIVVDDASESGAQNAPSLTVQSDATLTVHGSIIGGGGTCYRNTHRNSSGWCRAAMALLSLSRHRIS